LAEAPPWVMSGFIQELSWLSALATPKLTPMRFNRQTDSQRVLVASLPTDQFWDKNIKSMD
jgi:hypothetical protein